MVVLYNIIILLIIFISFFYLCIIQLRLNYQIVFRVHLLSIQLIGRNKDEKLYTLITYTAPGNVGHNEGFRGVFKASQGDACGFRGWTCPSVARGHDTVLRKVHPFRYRTVQLFAYVVVFGNQ